MSEELEGYGPLPGDLVGKKLYEWRQEIIGLRQKLAAKDAEIAELRRRVAECEEAVDQAVALAEYLEGHSKGAMAERVRTALSAKFAQERRSELANLMRRSMLLVVAEHERDEARECVGRLYPALRLAMSRTTGHAMDCERVHNFDEYDHTPPKACSCHIAKIGAALAATPEHLR